ncbi:sensor histidine kinase [Nocardiopsis sp. CNT312]|uniref:sensor histidine kinase n=1 Tax=Nocardiopsis sp. CNT312 TaxID=1137268 RepID=UPI00048F6DFA|nr:histidine kinase [Nocardiopsis sp. CNT312]
MTPDSVPGEATDGEVGGRRLRIAWWVTMGLVGFIILLVPLMAPLDAMSAHYAGFSVWPSAVALLPGTVSCVLLGLLFRDRVDGRSNAAPWLYWGSLAVLALFCALLLNPVFRVLAMAMWWSVAVFVARPGRGVVLTAVLLALHWCLVPVTRFEIHVLPYALTQAFAVVYGLLLGASVLLSVWMWDITRDAVRTQRARALLAVADERLRFSRDMHDLLGHSLSALSVKAELAARLAERAPERAESEIAEVRELARQSLQQVRSAVRGDRDADLAEEVASACTALRADGTEAVVTGLGLVDPRSRAAAAAAWVVREGATNVLRHSEAAECRLGFTPTSDGRTLVVEVSNDRAHPVGDPGSFPGSGLVGLSERVAGIGGSLTAAPTTDGGFLLRAVLPL